MKTSNLTIALIFACLLVLSSGCGAIPVRHVPKTEVSAANMPDLHGSQPLDLKAGECSTNEIAIGTVGMGKVMGKMSEWTAATVDIIGKNLLARGATIAAGSPKNLTITMTKAQVSAIPLVGISTGKVVLTAITPDGFSATFEGSGSSLAPLSAIDGAEADAIKKLLANSDLEEYLRK